MPGPLIRGCLPPRHHVTSAGRGLKSRPVAESRRRRRLHENQPPPSQREPATAISMGTSCRHWPKCRVEPECCHLPSTKAALTSPSSLSTLYVYGERCITIAFPRGADRLCRSLIHFPHVQVIEAQSRSQGGLTGAARSFLTFHHRSLGEPPFLTTPGAVRHKTDPPPSPPMHGALGRAAHGGGVLSPEQPQR
jgi:hypothetical protein